MRLDYQILLKSPPLKLLAGSTPVFGAARTCIFRRCIAFHPNNLVHLRVCQHSQGAQVGLVCKIQLRRGNVVVSLDILRFF